MLQINPPSLLSKNRLFRAWMLKTCLANKRRRDVVLERCQADLLFWINTFVWQYNPNAIGEASQEIGPFLTWDFQDEAVGAILRCIKDKRSLVILKSREMGASWLCLLVMDHFLLFQRYKKFLMISRNAEAVDRPNDSDCLFWKLDFVHDHLPTWMLDKQAGEVERRKFNFWNPKLKSAVTGQASTGAAGVGGRATGMFIDEFSRIKEDYDVLQSTANTTGCRIFNGTFQGATGAFYELSQRVDYRKLYMHWTQHPDKRRGLYRYVDAENRVEVVDKTYSFPESFEFVMSPAPTGGPHPGLRSPYYDNQCIEQGSSRAVAENLDIDPAGSASQFFNPLTLRMLQQTYCCQPYWEGDLTFDVQTGKPEQLVKLDGGPLKLWVNPTSKNEMPVSEYAAGADCSTGQGATNSVLSIGDAYTGEKVLEYATPFLKPEIFAALCCAVCWLFKNHRGEPAYFAWEKKGPGDIFGKCLVEFGYPRCYFRMSSIRGHGLVSQAPEPGWDPQPQTKRLLLEEYRAALESRQFINKSEEALSAAEAGSYQYDVSGKVVHPLENNNEDPSGAKQNHGDRVTADALDWMLIKKMNLRTNLKEERQREPPVGSLGWRIKLHEQADDEWPDAVVYGR